jgi:hypothetical protein
MKTLFALGCAAALLAGCASPYSSTPAYAERAGADAVDTARDCFRITQIQGHRIADPRTMYIDVGGRETYRLEMSGTCLAAASRQETLITESRTGGLICRPIDFDLKVKISGGFATPCIVQTMTKLTPAETAALPPELRP